MLKPGERWQAEHVGYEEVYDDFWAIDLGWDEVPSDVLGETMEKLITVYVASEKHAHLIESLPELVEALKEVHYHAKRQLGLHPHEPIVEYIEKVAADALRKAGVE